MSALFTATSAYYLQDPTSSHPRVSQLPAREHSMQPGSALLPSRRSPVASVTSPAAETPTHQRQPRIPPKPKKSGVAGRASGITAAGVVGYDIADMKGGV